MSKSKVVVYQAHDGNEQWVIVFATSSAEARRQAAKQMDCAFAEVDFCCRARPLDQYAPGPVPRLELIKFGLWFGCSGCGRRISVDATDEDDESVTLRPVERGESIYCGELCCADHNAHQAAAKAAEAAGIAMVTHYLLARVPDARVTRTHGYASRHGNDQHISLGQAWVEFTFPGSQYGGTARYDQFNTDRVKAQTHITIANGDMAAWHQYSALRDVALGLDRWADDGGPA